MWRNSGAVVGWLMYAYKNKFDAIVLLVDRDGEADREDEISEAQDYNDQGKLQFPRAMGAAVEAFDAWIFADEQALSKVLGVTIHTQPEPESIPNPKEHLNKLVKGATGKTADAKLYANVAHTIKVDRLKKQCPKGFGEFAHRLEQLKRQLQLNRETPDAATAQSA